MTEYHLYPASRDNQNEGWAWIQNECLSEEIRGQRHIIHIKQVGSPKSVYCEALYADPADVKVFNKDRENPENKVENPAQDHLIFLSSWYRRRLEIKHHSGPLTINLEITICKFPRSLWAQILACVEHPQLVVLLATVLGIIGVGLGLIGVGLGIIGIASWSPVAGDFGIVCMALGILVSAFGLVPLFKRAA